MSIFNQILNAIDSPEREASTGQLGSILDTVQQLSQSYQTNPDAIQSAMSLVGSYTKSALQEQRHQGNIAQVNQLVNQFGGTQANSQILSTLFSSSQIQRMIQQISQRTGLNSQTIMALLPVLVPLVLNLLKTGSEKSNIQRSNPVVADFLDSDGDGDVDLTDALNMASRYLRR
ncbi:MAG: DUF937 domain-containing protein [Pleurocapsa sp.]